MLEGYDKAVLADLKGKNDLEVEINFSDEERFKDCVKVKMGKDEAFISKQDLYSVVWSIADPENQEKMLPVKQTLVRKIVKKHIIEVKKPLKVGDKVIAYCHTNIPVEIYEGLKGMMPKIKDHVRKRSFSLPIIGAK